MWKIRELKSEGRRTLKKNYWRIVGISILMTFLVGGMEMGLYTDSPERALENGRLHVNTNADIIRDWHISMGDISQGDDEEKVLAFMGEHYNPTKGVLAKVYNRVTTERSVLYGILDATNNMVFKNRLGEGAIILIGSLIAGAIVALGINVLQVGQCRFIIENRSYHGSRLGRLLFPWRVRRWKHIAFVMFKKAVLLLLWDLTIIGGIIKRYSYKMVPYILAENPDTGSKEAFRLSIEMMKGNKFRAFLLDLSFIGWYVLNILTLGILRWVYILPYKDMVYGELYYTLRKDAIDRNTELSSCFNDEKLYADTDEEEYPVEEHRLYDGRVKRWIKIDYRRNYSITSLILIFFAFSVIGWMWEVSLHLFGDGVFVNRGFLHGPWLPIYGAGGVLVLVLLRRFAEKPALMFILTMAVCGVVEYFTSWILWETQHKYWWNYSGYFLNLNGRICAEGLIMFALGGCACVYIVAPFLDEMFKRIPKRPAAAICTMLALCFVADTVVSLIHPNEGKGVTNYGNAGSEKTSVTEAATVTAEKVSGP